MKEGITYRQLRQQAAVLLGKHEVPDADIDARLLLQDAAGCSGAELVLREKDPVPGPVWEKYQRAVRMRCCRMPLQQITQRADFMGIPLKVSDQVLIPRQDTETLAEEAIRRIQAAKDGKDSAIAGTRIRVLDLCTGSGCLIISLCRFCPGIEAVACDISESALDIARQNAENSGADVTFLQGDLFEGVEGKFDFILSNPPYIRTEDIRSLMEEVRDHEPRIALDGGTDGLRYYRRIAQQAPRYLKSGGNLLLEIGADEGEDVCAILSHFGFCGISVIRDLAGLDRVVCSTFPGKG